MNGTPITPAICVDHLKQSHNLDGNQADALMRKVVALTAQQSPGDSEKLIVDLPDEWENIFNQSPKQEHTTGDRTL